jgi:hypothetical protein
MNIGEGSRMLLQAVAAGRVQRAPIGAAGTPNARYLLDGQPIDSELAALVRDDLVYLPRVGPPRLTPDGEWALTNFT